MSKFEANTSKKFDLIFGADVIYQVENYPTFLKICFENLAPNGSFLIASKAYYYGNEGGISEFV